MSAEGGKSHRKKKAGRKAEKKKLAKSKKHGDEDGKQSNYNMDPEVAAKRNPRAFIFSSKGKAKIQKARSAEKEQRRMHVPAVERLSDEPPPFTVLVHGPPGVGKSTLIRCLIKHYTKQDIKDVKGPVTLVAGKSRRLTFIECPQDMTAMIDAAKYADLVLLLIDGDFGFEMETFEFLNLMQVHGFPKVMGVLTHLDTFTDTKALKKTKKVLKHRFWSEIYQGAKLFYLSGIKNGRYLNREVLNLARFISVMKFRPLSWRQNHPYFVVDRFEDTTSPEAIRRNPKCDRDIAVYGYLRGTNWKQGTTAHIAGAGDYRPTEVEAMPDPCPLPSQIKKRGLNEKERLIYAPMSDVGGLLYDKDAMYIDIPDWKVQYSAMTVDKNDDNEGETLVRGLQGTKMAVDEKLQNSKIQLFSRGPGFVGHDDLMDDEDIEASDEDDTSGDDTSDEDEPARGKEAPTEQVVEHKGRSRRRAIFSEHAATGYDDAILDSDNDDDDDEEENRHDVSSEDDGEGMGMASKWKGMFQNNIAALFSSRGADLQTYIYGNPNASIRKEDTMAAQHADSDSDDDLFFLKRSGKGKAKEDQTDNKENILTDIDSLDATKHSAFQSLENDIVEKWSNMEDLEQLRDRFVTGDWEAGQARDDARPEDDDDDEVYGDFEDIETGEVFKNSDDVVTQTAAKALLDVKKEELAAKKAAKKAAFDAAYDQGGTKAVEDTIGEGEESTKKERDDDDDDDVETYYDEMKRELGDRARKTKEAMDALDPVQRVAMEGHRPGAYIRMRFSGIQYELVEYFDPRYPVLIGGVGKSEESQGYMQLRLKRHRWYPKILKNRDPLIFSIGWRRFQSMPVFAIKDNNERHRMLKYSPEHMHCLAALWGPLAPPGTGVIAIQKMASSIKHWRISATGVILQLDATLNIVKKLKLVGTPFKIHRHTAFVNGMFNSQLEAAKFEGASVRTVSGIRGTIKKSLRVGSMAGARDGSFRATFEDKPLLSDIVFLRAWVGVDIPKFANPVTDLLGPRIQEQMKRAEKERRNTKKDGEQVPISTEQADSIVDFEPCHKFLGPKKGYIFTMGSQGLGYYEDVPATSAHEPSAGAIESDTMPIDEESKHIQGWVPMKSVADIRRERGIGAPRQNDSLYREIERRPRVFNPLKIPKSLQADLPFKSKPKIQAPRKRKTLEQKRAVVVEGDEKKKLTLVSQLNAIRNVKAQARREQRKKYQEKVAKRTMEEEAWRREYNKEERKKRYVLQGHKDKKQRMNS